MEKSLQCAVCGKIADPSIYRPDLTVVGGEFGRCSRCAEVFCEKCSKIHWQDPEHTWGVTACPLCDEELTTDLFPYNFQPQNLIQSHMQRVYAEWPANSSGDWGRAFMRGLLTSKLDALSELASGKMEQSLADAGRHSGAVTTADTILAVQTFGCSLKQAQEQFYQDGYLRYLNGMIAMRRFIGNANAHYVEFQFFWDGSMFWVQFTFIPNKELLSVTPIATLPTDLLTPAERQQVGLA